MSEKSTTTINIDEIRSIFKQYCEENRIEFSVERLEGFLKFLEIDFYDWVKENIKQFNKQG